jgi:N-acetylglucosaminyldiphosphoundecaprenol N-acetyl-beta-D-mannosaminyltransferase
VKISKWKIRESAVGGQDQFCFDVFIFRRMDVLGIDIDSLTREDIRERVDIFLREDRFHRIATVNPEFLVEADRNPDFRAALDAADLRVADGFGVVIVGWLRGERLRRFPGADLMDHILAKAEREGLGVFLAVRKDGLSTFEMVREAILKRYPNIVVSGENFDIADSKSRFLRSEINNYRSDILFCNFGAPEQEFFLEKLRKEKVSSRLLMGVGGSFDFLTEKRKRAPKWMRALGLEWLWRLLLQPTRAKRIWIATAVFLWKILRRKRKDSR